MVTFLMHKPQFVNEHTDVKTQVPGSKVINTLVGSMPALQDIKTEWHAPWEKASDPVTPHVSWQMTIDMNTLRQCIQAGHTHALYHQILECGDVQYWDEGFGELQTLECRNDILPVHPQLSVQSLKYLVDVRYHMFLWDHLYPYESRNPLSVYPGKN